MLNWIDGYDSTRTVKLADAPAIFGMNFQAISVGQKLAKAGDADVGMSGLVGGYADGNGDPNNALLLQARFVDQALGRFEAELKARKLDQSTLVIVSAKHGQSPIDVRDRVAISDAPFQAVPGYGSHGFEICDDEGLVWLDPSLQKTHYAAARAYLLDHAAELHIETLLDRERPDPALRRSVHEQPRSGLHRRHRSRGDLHRRHQAGGAWRLLERRPERRVDRVVLRRSVRRSTRTRSRRRRSRRRSFRRSASRGRSCRLSRRKARRPLPR